MTIHKRPTPRLDGLGNLSVGLVVEVAEDASVVPLAGALQRLEVVGGGLEHGEENLLEGECLLLVFPRSHVLEVLEQDTANVYDV